MDMPRPTDAHQKLERLAGTWTGEENMHPSEWLPDGGTAHGVTTSRKALAGFGVVTDYEQSMGGSVTFQGHGIYTIDQQTQDVVLHWFDSLGGGHEEFRGNWTNADQLVLRSKSPMMGHMRLSYEFRADGSMGSQMENSQDGETWRTMFDAVYTNEA